MQTSGNEDLFLWDEEYAETAAKKFMGLLVLQQNISKSKSHRVSFLELSSNFHVKLSAQSNIKHKLAPLRSRMYLDCK